MTKYSMSLREYAVLITLLKDPKIKVMYDGMVKAYMEVSCYSEDDAKRAIFPAFLAAAKEVANKPEVKPNA